MKLIAAFKNDIFFHLTSYQLHRFSNDDNNFQKNPNFYGRNMLLSITFVPQVRHSTALSS